MEKLERPIIVPWDFSPVAENAFQHAVNVSKALNREILILHVVAEKRDVDSKKGELEASSETLGNEYGKKPHTSVVDGSIFNAIGETAKELKAEMIIMGTHGMKGAQKLFGSKALKVVVSSRIPFLVVQDKPVKDKIDTILLPLISRGRIKRKPIGSTIWLEILEQGLLYSNPRPGIRDSKERSYPISSILNLSLRGMMWIMRS